VALAVRGGAGVHQSGTVVLDLDLRGFAHRVDATGDLDVDADTDAQQLLVAGLAAAGLLGAEIGIPGGVERLVERTFEVADVVDVPDRRGVRLHELGDQVHAAHLCRVLADLGGEEVHRPFGSGGGLGSTGAPVRDGGCGVGEHGRGTALDVGDVVDGGDHRPGHREGEDTTDVHEPACVLEQVQLVVRDLALTGSTDRDVLQLRTAVTQVHHRLAPRLAPANRPRHGLRDRTEQHLLGVRADLGAERAAHVGGDHTDLIGLDAVGRSDRRLDALGVLGGQPLVEAPVDPGGGRTTYLQRAGSDALVEESPGDHDLAVGEVVVRRSVLGHPEGGGVEHGVRAGRLVDQRLRRHRRLDVDQRGEEVDVDEHRVGGIGGLRQRLGHDGHHRLADEAHLVAGEHRAGDGRIELRRHRLEAERLRGEDRHDAGHRLGGVGVDRQDRAVGDRGSGVDHVQRTGEEFFVQVVDVDAPGGEELRILFALDTSSQDAAGHEFPFTLRCLRCCRRWCGACVREPSRRRRGRAQPCGRRRSR
jgi:hypothetical protein